MLARKELPQATTPVPTVLAIERIQQILASEGTPGMFATRRAAGSDDISLDVVGVGAVPLPLARRTAEKLRTVAKPARYGLREKTLLDPSVRATWEIGKRQIKLEEHHWRRTLDRELPRIARDLGVPDGATLRAELRNLLVYEPGQFFAPHQDSEKADGMIGSLVVMLPSDAKGGALVIEHHDERASYRGSSNQLVLVAFYADCRHEVRPITAGYRAALTFNLFLDRVAQRRERSPSKSVDALVELARAHFETSRQPRWAREAEPPPERLVYLLDHEYTQKGLSWRALKNGDAVRAEMLRKVAERLDCEIVLALADVHESWSYEDEGGYDGYRYGRQRCWGRYEEAEEDDEERAGGDPDYTLVELFDSDVELRHWVSTANKRVQPISGEVRDDEICFTKPSVDLEPFRSEHEGYTGNAGNTVDRWYHRAAVLLWPRTRAFAIRTKAAPAWGIREIAKTLARGKLDIARQRVVEVLPFWKRAALDEKPPGFADHVLQVAHAIDDAELATALVAPLAIEQVAPKSASRWGDLLARYGLTWCTQVVERWASRDQRYGEAERRLQWLGTLPALATPLCAREDGVGLARRILDLQWRWLSARLDGWTKPPVSSFSRKSLAAASRAIVALCCAAEIAGRLDLQSRIVERLTSERDYPAAGALAVLREAVRGAAAVGLGPLLANWTRALTALVATPPRPPGDWSITTTLGCRCDLCVKLDRFLRAPDQQQLEWRLAKERRTHVHGTISSHELPVTHVTRRTGSPFTLVLTKTRALLTRDAAERATWARDLAWLRENGKAFSSPRRTPARRTARR